MIARGGRCRPDRLEHVQGEITLPVYIEGEKPLLRGKPEFTLRYAAIEVGVRGNHGFGEIEKAVSARALMLVGVERADETAASAMVMTAASVTFTPTLRVAGFHQFPVEMFAGLDLWRDHFFVMGELVRIDFAVVVQVEQREEAVGILLHLFQCQPPVMIAIGLLEPIRQGVVCSPVRPKGLTHGAYEQAAAASGRIGRWRGRRWRRLLTRDGQEEKEGKNHRSVKALAELAAK